MFSLEPGLCFSALGGTGSQGSACSQGQLLAQLQGAPFSCAALPLASSGAQQAAGGSYLSWKQRCMLGEGSPGHLLRAGRERTFTGFLPSRGPQTSDWMLRTDLPFPSACRSWARGEMGTASAGPCPRQPASTGSRGWRAGRGWEAVRRGGLVSVN